MACKLFIFGASGKMGTVLSSLLAERSDLTKTSSLEEADVLIDFSAAVALMNNLRQALTLKRPLIIGTTGHRVGIDETLQEAARHIPIFIAPNFSLGIALLKHLLKELKERMPKDFKAALQEAHHISKKDAPSGTALALAKSFDLPKECITYERTQKTEFVHAMRLQWGEEELHLKHAAHSRRVFAQGALEAAQFIVHKRAGLYSMEDLICAKTAHC